MESGDWNLICPKSLQYATKWTFCIWMLPVTILQIFSFKFSKEKKILPKYAQSHNFGARYLFGGTCFEFKDIP